MRRKRFEEAHANSNPMLLPELARVFRILRPIFYTAKDKCFFDSLVLLEFCSRYRLFPSWVIGVTTQPFQAHSWVQEGTIVVNDTAERARVFTPIVVA